MHDIVTGLFAGLCATVVLDAWAYASKHWLGLPTANWSMVGRWIGHMPQGRFIHQSVADATPVAGEAAIGWTFHYMIGLLYGLAYVLLLRISQSEPTLLSALVLAWVFLAAPWLIMQPGLGIGIFSRKAPKPWLMRGVSVLAHTFFGVGLFAGMMLARVL